MIPVKSAWICKLQNCILEQWFYFWELILCYKPKFDAGFINLSCIRKRTLDLDQPKNLWSWRLTMKFLRWSCLHWAHRGFFPASAKSSSCYCAKVTTWYNIVFSRYAVSQILRNDNFGFLPNHNSYGVVSTDFDGALFKVNAAVSNA